MLYFTLLYFTLLHQVFTLRKMVRISTIVASLFVLWADAVDVPNEQSTDQLIDMCEADITTHEEDRKFKGTTLAFVTPWQPEGKEVALKFAKKLTHVSPFWYHITPKSFPSEDTSNWEVSVEAAMSSGPGAPDKKWVSDMQENGVKVIPVFAFYGWTKTQMAKFFTDKKSGNVQHSVGRQIVLTCKQLNCDGLMLEWGIVPMNEYYEPLNAWIQRIVGSMRKFITRPHQFMLSVHPDPTHFSNEVFESLAPSVSKFVVHMYNFTGPALAQGPNAPISWMKDLMNDWHLIQRRDADDLVLVVLNLFGREYRTEFLLDVEQYDVETGDPMDKNGQLSRWDVSGKQFNQLLKDAKTKEIELKHKWHADYEEFVIKYKTASGEPRAVYYPSLRSLSHRVEVCFISFFFF